MARRSGGKIVTDGLVLALDGADITSFRGEPTVNVVTNTNLDTGWSKGYQTNIVFNEIDPPVGIDSPVVGHDRGNSSGYWYSYGNYAPQVPNTIYTVSMYVKTLDSNFNITFYTADNSETGRVWGSYIQVPNDGKWHRIIWNSFTNPSNSQSDSLSFNFYYDGAIGSPTTRTWFCAPQMEAKSYATPFVIGTRGATVATGGGWADLSGNTNHGELVNGVGYDSGNGGSLTFDGVDDYVDFGSDIVFKSSGGWTVENWVNFDFIPTTYNNTTSPANFIGSETITHNSWYWSVLSSKLALWNRSPGVWKYGSTVLQAYNWYNVVLVCNDSGTSYQMYLNGIAEGGDHTTYTWNATYSGLNVRYIARGNSSNIRQLNGKIPITKIYNRALTADEVLQNFNATRGRFGI